MTRLKPPHHLIAASFLLIGALLAYLARERGGAAWALLWPASNCLLVGAAYYGEAGKVFGKREDGSFSPFRRAFMLPFLLATWTVWRLQVFLERENAFDRAAEGVFLGRRPRRGEYPPGTDCVADLTSEFARPPHHPEGADYFCLPVLDAFVPEDAAFAELVEKAAAKKTVFAHCANGHGRSAVFCAALLLRRGDVALPEEAWEVVLRARPLCALNPAQAALLERFAARLIKPPAR